MNRKLSKFVTFDLFSGGKELYLFLKKGDRKYAISKSHNGYYPLREGTNFNDWRENWLAEIRVEIFYAEAALGTDLEKYFQISEGDFGNLFKLKKECEEIKFKNMKMEDIWRKKAEELKNF